MTITINSKRQLAAASRQILEAAAHRRIFAFYGVMGAGKTTIIKSLCRVLGATDAATSPTFTIANEYRTATGEPIYHFDFYRIRQMEEVFDIGLEEYLAGTSYCFIEWPELAEDALPAGTVRVRIDVTGSNRRILHMAV